MYYEIVKARTPVEAVQKARFKLYDKIMVIGIEAEIHWKPDEFVIHYDIKGIDLTPEEIKAINPQL